MKGSTLIWLAAAYFLLMPKEDEAASIGGGEKLLFHVFSDGKRVLSTESATTAVSEAKFYSRIKGESFIKVDDNILRYFKNGKLIR